MAPDRFDQRIDFETRHRLAKIQDGYLRISHRLLFAMIFQIVVLLLTAAAITYLVNQNRERIDSQEQVTARIQQERRHAIRDNCEDINARHERTVERLRVLAAKAPHQPGQPPRREALRNTITLIDALVPKRDCAVLVEQAVGPIPKQR